MRPLLPGDLDAAVRALLAVPEGERPALARALVRDASAAEAYRRATGRAHPIKGTGSLMSAAHRRAMAPLPETCDRGYCACLLDLLRVLLPASRSGESAPPRNLPIPCLGPA